MFILRFSVTEYLSTVLRLQFFFLLEAFYIKRFIKVSDSVSDIVYVYDTFYLLLTDYNFVNIGYIHVSVKSW